MASAFGGGGSQTAFGARAGATGTDESHDRARRAVHARRDRTGNPRTEWPGIGDGGRGWTGAGAAAADCTAAASDAADAAGDAATCSAAGDAGEAAGTAAAGPAAAEITSPSAGDRFVSWLPPSGGRSFRSFRLQAEDHPRNAESTDCESGGTGRRTSLRGWRSQERESSNLSFRTNLEWRGPLHPAKLTALRSLFAARSALFALLRSRPTRRLSRRSLGEGGMFFARELRLAGQPFSIR